MSLPSINSVAQLMGVNLPEATAKQNEQVLLGAMKKDLPLAVFFLEQQFLIAETTGKSVDWRLNPKLPMGQQLLRLHASDALRPLAEKYFCPGYRLSFFNCCGGTVSKDAMTTEEAIAKQIRAQDGTVASPDC